MIWLMPIVSMIDVIEKSVRTVIQDGTAPAGAGWTRSLSRSGFSLH